MSRRDRRAAGHRGPLPRGASGTIDGSAVFNAWTVDVVDNAPLRHPFAILGLGAEDAAPTCYLAMGCNCQLDGLIEDLQKLRARYSEFNVDCEGSHATH